MEPRTILLICMLILAISALFCGNCIERVSKGGSAIGYNTFGMSVDDLRSLRNDGPYSDGERDYVMNELRDPITGGENPALYEQYLDYGSTYYPHKRFPKANIPQVLATGK